MSATGQRLSRRTFQSFSVGRSRSCGLPRQTLRPARYNAQHSHPYIFPTHGQTRSDLLAPRPSGHTTRCHRRRRGMFGQSRPDGIPGRTRIHRRGTFPYRRQSPAVGHKQHCRVFSVDTYSSSAEKKRRHDNTYIHRLEKRSGMAAPGSFKNYSCPRTAHRGHSRATQKGRCMAGRQQNSQPHP